ncbi:unnamed protein product, partial [Staurois parvus]
MSTALLLCLITFCTQITSIVPQSISIHPLEPIIPLFTSVLPQSPSVPLLYPYSPLSYCKLQSPSVLSFYTPVLLCSSIVHPNPPLFYCTPQSLAAVLLLYAPIPIFSSIVQPNPDLSL